MPSSGSGARHHAYPKRCRRGRVEKRLSFPYGRTLVVGRFVALASLIVLMAVTVALLPSLSVVPVAVLAVVLAAFFVPGARTNLVSLRLSRPRRFWQSFGFRACVIVSAATERTKFLEALDE